MKGVDFDVTVIGKNVFNKKCKKLSLFIYTTNNKQSSPHDTKPRKDFIYHSNYPQS